jgi:hypothetical protein
MHAHTQLQATRANQKEKKKFTLAAWDELSFYSLGFIQPEV